jgi:hypothetical protein
LLPLLLPQALAAHQPPVSILRRLQGRPVLAVVAEQREIPQRNMT